MTSGVDRLRAIGLFWSPVDTEVSHWQLSGGCHWPLAASGSLFSSPENQIRRKFVPRMVYTSKTALHSTYILDVQPMPTPPRESAVPRLRWDLVVRVRREIEAGTYETNEKWEIALSRLQAELERQPCTDDEQPAW